jgi:hypothetical protein
MVEDVQNRWSPDLFKYGHFQNQHGKKGAGKYSNFCKPRKSFRYLNKRKNQNDRRVTIEQQLDHFLLPEEIVNEALAFKQKKIEHDNAEKH